MTVEELQGIVEAIKQGNIAMTNLKNYVNTWHHGRMPVDIAEKVVDAISLTSILTQTIDEMSRIAIIAKAQRVLESEGYTVTKK